MTNPQANCETPGCTVKFTHTHVINTVYDTSNERAKTAEEIVDNIPFDRGLGHHEASETHDYCAECQICVSCTEKEIIKALESYADSVAEERVKAKFKQTLYGCTHHPMCDCGKGGYDEGFRAGQERMRERAAKIAIENIDDNATIIHARIWYLEVEEK